MKIAFARKGFQPAGMRVPAVQSGRSKLKRTVSLLWHLMKQEGADSVSVMQHLLDCLESCAARVL